MDEPFAVRSDKIVEQDESPFTPCGAFKGPNPALEANHELNGQRPDTLDEVDETIDIFDQLVRERDQLRADLDQLRAETESALVKEAYRYNDLANSYSRLREELVEWKAAHASTVQLREMVESHMDMARGEWQCQAEIEELKGDRALADKDTETAMAEVERLRGEVGRLIGQLANEVQASHAATRGWQEALGIIEELRIQVHGYQVFLATRNLTDECDAFVQAHARVIASGMGPRGA